MWDENNNSVVGETLTFTIDGKTSTATTNGSGQAKITVSVANEGNYTMEVNYFSDEVEYHSSSAQAVVAVNLPLCCCIR